MHRLFEAPFVSKSHHTHCLNRTVPSIDNGSGPFAHGFRCLFSFPLLFQLCITRDSSGYEDDSRDLIRLKNQVRMELKALQNDTTHLRELAAADMKKRKKPSEDVLSERMDFLKTLQEETARITALATGREVRPTTADTVTVRVTTDDLMGDGPIRGMNRRQEAVTSQQQVVIDSIHAEQKVQDDILDQMDSVLVGLKHQAQAMHDEVERQNKAIDDVLDKAEDTADQLDVVNIRMKETLKKLNSKGTMFCAYITCFLILLGVLYALWRVTKEK